MLKLVIQTPPRTKKNSQQIFRNAKGTPFVTASKAYKSYLADCAYFVGPLVGLNLKGRYNVQALYYMGTRHKVDLINLHSALHDMMVHYKIIEDDHSGIIVSTDGSRVYYDKLNPRTEILITEVE